MLKFNSHIPASNEKIIRVFSSILAGAEDLLSKVDRKEFGVYQDLVAPLADAFQVLFYSRNVICDESLENLSNQDYFGFEENMFKAFQCCNLFSDITALSKSGSNPARYNGKTDETVFFRFLFEQFKSTGLSFYYQQPLPLDPETMDKLVSLLRKARGWNANPRPESEEEIQNRSPRDPEKMEALRRQIFVARATAFTADPVLNAYVDVHGGFPDGYL